MAFVQIDVRLDGISDDSTSSMQIDPVPMSRSREASPEPTVISFEESQELVNRQSLGMRTKHHRTRPASAPRPVNDSVATCSQPDFLSWKLQIEKRNQERHGRTPPDRDFAERLVPLCCYVCYRRFPATGTVIVKLIYFTR